MTEQQIFDMTTLTKKAMAEIERAGYADWQPNAGGKETEKYIALENVFLALVDLIDFYPESTSASEVKR